MSDTLRIGSDGERAATEFLRRNGYLIVERNWRSGHHEIDIIATLHDEYHFVEVKTRKAGSLTTPAEAITKAKIRNLVEAVNSYVALHDIQSDVWLDLAAVETDCGGNMAVELIPDVSNLHW